MRENVGDEYKCNGAFYAYDWKLELIIDILKNVPIKNMPNSFFGMLANSLNDVAAFIGYRIGESFAAGQRWDNEKSNLSEEVIDALWLFAKSSRHLFNLKILLKNI